MQRDPGDPNVCVAIPRAVARELLARDPKTGLFETVGHLGVTQTPDFSVGPLRSKMLDG